MHPCFRGLVLNVVLDVFLPLIGVWLQGERWQLGETALPLMNSSSSIPAQTACGYIISPSIKKRKKIQSPHYLGPHGQPAVFATLHASTAYRVYFVCTLTLMTPGFVHKSCQLCSVLKCPCCCIVLVWICLRCVQPKNDYLQWSRDLAVRSTLDLSIIKTRFKLHKEIRIGLFAGYTTVKVGAFICLFWKSSPIRTSTS